jgi:hypothetical protein
MLDALLVGVVYCAIVLVVAWLLTVLIGLVPVPPPISGVLPTIIWAIAIIICLVILLNVLRGTVPPLMLAPLIGPLP